MGRIGSAAVEVDFWIFFVLLDSELFLLRTSGLGPSTSLRDEAPNPVSPPKRPQGLQKRPIGGDRHRTVAAHRADR